MAHQIRPGARGGRDQVSWDQVKEDKQRLNYLGSSIHGVPDKFKKGPETFWYAKEQKTEPEASKKNEIEAIKSKEKQMMEVLLCGNAKPKPQIERLRDQSPEFAHIIENSRRREHSSSTGEFSKDQNSRNRLEEDRNLHSRHRLEEDRSSRHSRYRYEEGSRHRYSDSRSHRSSQRCRSRSPRRSDYWINKYK